MKPSVLFCCGLLTITTSASAAEKKFSVTVEAGDFDRRGAVVAFALPDSMKGEELSLQRGGKTFPIQVARDGQASFMTGDLKRGEGVSYELTTGRATYAATALGQVLAQKAGSKLKLTFVSAASRGSPGRPLLDYEAGPGTLPRADIKQVFQRGGYLHPIYTPAGKMVTDDYPPNHIHHHGVWSAWTHTEFEGREPDFWNMGEAKGRVDFVSLDESWSGPVHGGFRARHRFVDLLASPPVAALNETWEVKAYASPAGSSTTHWFFDLVSEQQCATTHALKLPKYHYGGIGLRGNRAWNGKDETQFLTSEGETDRAKANTTLGRWCDMSGQVDGQRAGIAILCHPENFRAPQPMRLHPTEPFFSYAPQQAGDMEIKPGEKYVSRYRFVVHDGPADKAELDRLWNDYAHPPTVKVVEKR